MEEHGPDDALPGMVVIAADSLRSASSPRDLPEDSSCSLQSLRLPGHGDSTCSKGWVNEDHTSRLDNRDPRHSQNSQATSVYEMERHPERTGAMVVTTSVPYANQHSFDVAAFRGSLTYKSKAFEDLNAGANMAIFSSTRPLSAAVQKTPLQVKAFLGGLGLILMAVHAALHGTFFNRPCPVNWVTTVLVVSRMVEGTIFILAAAFGRWGGRLRHMITQCLGICATCISVEYFILSFVLFASGHWRWTPVIANYGVIYVTWGWVLCVDEALWQKGILLSSLCAFVHPIILDFCDNGSVVSTGLYLLLGGMFLAIPVYFRVMRRLELSNAKKALRPHLLAYNQIWAPIAEEQADALKQLVEWVGIQPNQRALQPETNLDTLYEMARQLNTWFQLVVAEWVCHLDGVEGVVGIEHHQAPVKQPTRAMEKLQRSYQGNVARLLDLARSTIIVKTIDDVLTVAKLISLQARVHFVKNRFDPAYDGEDTGGYRDLNMQISLSELEGTLFEGHIFEMQIHLDAIAKIKHEDGHALYTRMRNLRCD